MLVLPHANGLGINFHQLRQRVLQAAGDGNGGAQIHIVLRKLLCGQWAGGVDGGSGLRDDHIADASALILGLGDQLHSHLLRLSAGSAVSNGDVFYMILLIIFLSKEIASRRCRSP